jgi:DNA invertase Pin-like site-specific DNA recombinase
MKTSRMPEPGGPSLTSLEEAIVQTGDPINPPGAIATGHEDATAPPFAPRHSRGNALQEAKAGAQRLRTPNGQASQAGRSPLLTHPIVLRDLPAHADARPSQSQLTRLHRSLTQRDLVILQSLYVEFFRFMAEMTERRILVFDANGLISNVDRLSWKIKAIVAQEEREKVSRRVRDNLRYLRRNGQLLGTIPQGYCRVDGRIVEDPDAAPAIKEIFRLYATGCFSLRSLAEHLNRSGIKPDRGPGKANHNRSKAIIFTGDVLKDLIGNPSYAGKIRVEGELVQGLHPALVDQETWQACQDVKKRNVRRTSKAWTKHTYPLTPILLCARCGGPMHGEADSRKGRIQRYYGCHVARRNRSAVHPSGPRCDARMFKSELLEDAIHHELSQLVPSGEMHAALRNRLRAAGRPTASLKTTAAAVQRLGAQLDRARRLFEYGEYDWETFCKRRDEFNEQKRQLENATDPGSVDVEWCESQLLDFTTAWEKADSSQRERLLAGIFEHLEAEALPEGSLRVVAVPREAWRPFFEGLVLERETGFEPATSTLARSRSTK